MMINFILLLFNIIMKIHFKKRTSQKIFLSDNRFKYTLDHQYWGWNEKEVPIDSTLFKQYLGNRTIVVVKINGTGIVSGLNFNNYLVVDKYTEETEQKKIEVVEKKIFDKKIEAKKTEKKKLKEVEKKEKKKVKEDEIKNKVEILDDTDIFSNL